MNVSICSRREIEKLLTEDFPQNIAVISFVDSMLEDSDEEDYAPVDYSGKAKRYFQIAIQDIHYDELEEYGMNYRDYFPEADGLAEFVIQSEEDGFDIICQCEYGQSRSAGCAAAILEFFYHNGISIFADYKYCPNQMVFHKVYDALRMSH